VGATLDESPAGFEGPHASAKCSSRREREAEREAIVRPSLPLRHSPGLAWR
jgi:hypothetical protein